MKIGDKILRKRSDIFWPYNRNKVFVITKQMGKFFMMKSSCGIEIPIRPTEIDGTVFERIECDD